MKQQQSMLEYQLSPFNILLRAVLSQLQEKDRYSVFAQPVSIKEVCLLCISHTAVALKADPSLKPLNN